MKNSHCCDVKLTAQVLWRLIACYQNKQYHIKVLHRIVSMKDAQQLGVKIHTKLFNHMGVW